MGVYELPIVGEVVVKILEGKGYNNNDKITRLTFVCASGKIFNMKHNQDCCETVVLEDVVGDLESLLNTEILSATEVQEDENINEYDGCNRMWTYYKFITKNGYVDLRWFGESNGYYAVDVDFDLLSEESINLKNCIHASFGGYKLCTETKEVLINVVDEELIIGVISKDAHLKVRRNVTKEELEEEYFSVEEIEILKTETDDLFIETVMITLSKNKLISLMFYVEKSKSIAGNNVIKLLKG